MRDEERSRRIGARIALARREAGLTQAAFAKKLGITARSVQNHEAGVSVPYRHLGRIESITGRRPGWILDDDDGAAHDLRATLETLRNVLEEHQLLLRVHLDALRRQTELLRDQREASTRRRSRRPTP